MRFASLSSGEKNSATRRQVHDTSQLLRFRQPRAVSHLDPVAVTAREQLGVVGVLAAAAGSVEVVDIEDEEDGHDDGHEQGVEYVQEYLVRDEVPAVALEVLDDAKDASDHDNDADGVEDRQVALPGEGGLLDRALVSRGRHLARTAVVAAGLALADVEDDGGDDEEAKDGKLDEQTDDDDLLTKFVEFQSARGLDTTTASLEEEGNDIASNKDLGHPLQRDDGEALRVDRGDEPTENHVD